MDTTPAPGSSAKTIEDTVEQPSGVRLNTHGVSYQLKLLVLAMFRARQQGLSFSLGTEVGEADKFDDIVFSFHNQEDSTKYYRLVQAKHRQDDSKTVDREDLLDVKDDNFSILKYFVSFRKIVNNKKFNGKVKDLIICTNIDFDSNVISSMEELDSREDKIFGHSNAKQYKIKKDSEIWKDLVEILKKHHQKQLVKTLANIVVKNKIAPNNLLKTYSRWLLDKVLKLETVNNKRHNIVLQDKFLHNTCDGDTFLENFKTELIQSIHSTETTKTPIDIANMLKNVNIELKQSFAVESKDYLSLNVSDDEITKFFETLVLAVRQPNEKQLGNIISDEMSEDLNLIEGKFVASRVLENILDWVNEKLGRFLHINEIEEIFQSCKQNIARLGLVGLSLAHKLKFKTCYKFKDDDKVVETVNKFFKDTTEKILTIYSETYSQTIMKILQAQAVNKTDENFLCDVKLIQQLVGTVVCPIEAFRSESYNNLIIYFEPNAKVNETKFLLKNIFEILKEKSNKRIVLVIPREEADIAGSIFEELSQHELIKLIDNANGFSDLTAESQEELLKSAVTYQGKVVTLSSLIERDPNLITQQVLSKLLSNETTCIDDINNTSEPEVKGTELTELITKLSLTLTTLLQKDATDKELFKLCTDTLLKELVLEEKIRMVEASSKVKVRNEATDVDRVIASIQKFTSMSLKDAVKLLSNEDVLKVKEGVNQEKAFSKEDVEKVKENVAKVGENVAKVGEDVAKVGKNIAKIGNWLFGK